MISKGTKTLDSWKVCSFLNGDGTWVYLFVPGVFIGNDKSELKLISPTSGSIRIRSNYNNTDVNMSVSELYDIAQYSYGIILSFRHSGIGYAGTCVICTDMTIGVQSTSKI